MKKDYAKISNMNSWLRHPVLGDPSFDSFKHFKRAVHTSEPPYEWAVNGSVFRDFDGTWYYYAGLYGYGYSGETAKFKIYRSKDKGENWEDLGFPFEKDFFMDGHSLPSKSCPDVFMCWDEKRKKYLLTYDTSSFTHGSFDAPWDSKDFENLIKSFQEEGCDCGASYAWGSSPAGPFERAKKMAVSTRNSYRMTGRWNRLYASCIVPRKNDYIAFSLCDSGNHFAWGLAVMTAPEPDGPWSEPRVVLSCDRPEYYPCPVEFFPVEIQGEKVVAHATSVAMNRNYQAFFTCDLEKAHDPSAWILTDDGNVWHSEDNEYEKYGIWGQTIHGFVDPETKNYIAMFPAKDSREYGALSLAKRPFDTPHTDGFTFTGHEGPSVSPLYAQYKDFKLDVTFKTKGCIDIAFNYSGVLGPDKNTSLSSPCGESLKNYSAIRIEGNSCSLISIDNNGNITRYANKHFDQPINSVSLCYTDEKATVTANGKIVCSDIKIPLGERSAIALVAAPFSRIECQKFEIEGEALPFAFEWNVQEGLLGAGQFYAPVGCEWGVGEALFGKEERPIFNTSDQIRPDRWHNIKGGVMGEGNITAKWNLQGDDFTVHFIKAENFGAAGIYVDGIFTKSVDLCSSGKVSVTISGLSGRRAITVRPMFGRIAICGCTASGKIR